MKTVPHLPGFDLEDLKAADVARIGRLALLDEQKIEQLVRVDYPARKPWAIALVEQAYSGYGYASGLWKRIGGPDVDAAIEAVAAAERRVAELRDRAAALQEAERLGVLAAGKVAPDLDQAIYLSRLSYVPAIETFYANFPVGGPAETVAAAPDLTGDASGDGSAAVETSGGPPTPEGRFSGDGAPADPAPATSGGPLAPIDPSTLSDSQATAALDRAIETGESLEVAAANVVASTPPASDQP